MELDQLEKEMFKAISGFDFYTSCKVMKEDRFKECCNKAKAAASLCREKCAIAVAFDESGAMNWRGDEFYAFDTGARLPEQKEFHPSFVHTQSTEIKIEQKEESQEVSRLELKNAIHQVYISGEWDKSLVMSFADALAPILQSKFIIRRKP